MAVEEGVELVEGLELVELDPEEPELELEWWLAEAPFCAGAVAVPVEAPVDVEEPAGLADVLAGALAAVGAALAPEVELVSSEPLPQALSASASAATTITASGDLDIAPSPFSLDDPRRFRS